MNKLQANLCLLCVTLCWSTEVIIFACIPDNVLPFATTSITSSVAAVILAFCFFKRIKTEMRRAGKQILLRCLFLGLLKCGYDVLYLYGLNMFDVTSGAFTISLTVVVMPFLLLILRKKVTLKIWISVALILSGILFALIGNITPDQLWGVALMLGGGVVRSFFIIKLNDFAKEYDSVTLSVWVSVISAVFSFIIWLILQPATFGAIEWNGIIICSLFIYAYFIAAFAQTLNIFAQRRATASGATIIYSLEIVFSLTWSTVLPGNVVDHAVPNLFQIIGAAFIVAGSLFELFDFRHKRRLNHDTAE